jgi:hypothetical protein
MPGTFLNNVAYSLNQPLSTIFNPPFIAKRDPLTTDKAPIGQIWVNTSSNAVFILTSIANNVANWMDITEGAGVFTSLTVNPGPTNLSTVGNGAVTIGNSTNTGAVTISVGSGNFALNGNGNTINIGHDNAANNVVIGTIANAGSLTTIAGGTGTGVGTAAVDLVTADAGDIVIGTATQTGAVYIRPSTAGGSTNIANAANTSAQTVNIANGASGANSTVNILTGAGTAGTQTLNILATGATRAGAINIATGAAAHVLSIGSTSSGAQTWNVGTGSFAMDGNGNTIGIGNDAAANTVTLGSTNTTATTTIQGGTGGIALNAGGDVSVLPAILSTASTTPTLNARVGRLTITGLTTASAGSQAITITNSSVTTTSFILASIYNLDASGNHAAIAISKTVVAANTLTITFINNGAGALGAGDNVTISFWVAS